MIFFLNYLGKVIHLKVSKNWEMVIQLASVFHWIDNLRTFYLGKHFYRFILRRRKRNLARERLQEWLLSSLRRKWFDWLIPSSYMKGSSCTILWLVAYKWQYRECPIADKSSSEMVQIRLNWWQNSAKMVDQNTRSTVWHIVFSGTKWSFKRPEVLPK